jgi:3-hydroxyisobutyrate dehydrogenase
MRGLRRARDGANLTEIKGDRKADSPGTRGHHNEIGHSKTGEKGMKLGFIGTGNMGNPMAANLIRAGHQLTVHDLRREAATNLLEMGAEWAGSPKEAVPGNDAVLTSLPVPRDVEAVVLGEDGILEGAASGSVIFDLSTNSPTVIRRLHESCAQRGVTLLDSPVSGGTYGAAAGTLAVMVGGDRATFERFEPTLGAIGTHVVYCGDIGAGSVCKICNNLMSMGIGVLLSEALTMGVKAGVDLATLADVISHSSGSSRRLTEKFSRFLFQGNFEPGFATALAAKDVRLATDLGREYGVPMDLSNLVDQRHVEAMFRGFGPEDSDAVARIQEEKAGVQLRLDV